MWVLGSRKELPVSPLLTEGGCGSRLSLPFWEGTTMDLRGPDHSSFGGDVYYFLYLLLLLLLFSVGTF